jgi:hypothetical protein
MPRWNEEAAQRLFSPLEWLTIARLAKDLGEAKAEETYEALPDEEELPTDLDAVLPLARQALEQSALLAMVADNAEVRAVFSHNFWLGWKCYDCNAGAYTYVEAPFDQQESW